MPLAPSLRRSLAAGAAVLLACTVTGGSVASADVPDDTEFYVAKPNHDAKRQIADLTRQGRKTDAALIREIIETPTAVWVESGSPKRAEQQVRQVTRQAAGKGTVPTLVIYNIPFRDCAQYSSGGATTMAEYKAWIDGVARGIGDREVMIALEPDGLGIIPWYNPIGGDRDNPDTPQDEDPTLEWCQPAEASAATAAAERFEMLNHAVDAFKALPQTSVYLDGTHNGWLNVGDISDRLVKAGVERADGFFLNASNYQWTQNLEQYGTWVSSCLAYLSEVKPGDFRSCGNQYWSGGPANNWGKDWIGTGYEGGLDPSLQWSDTAANPAANTAGINSRYALVLGDVEPSKTFIIDTSRNGQGPWDPTQYGFYQDANDAWYYQPAGGAAVKLQGDPQTWCNPPDRGIGPRPTADTGHPLVDAYIWIKVPGESDGQCSRGLGTGDNVVDPMWGQVDPDAGVWFPEQAIELAHLAVPRLR